MTGTTQTILQQQTIDDTASSWLKTIQFTQFDPSLGALRSIDVGLTADVTGSVAVESLEAAPSTVSVRQSGTVTVSNPTGAALVSAVPSASASADLGPYDGSTNFADGSGTTFALSNTATADASWPQVNGDPGPFIGTGSVALTVGDTTAVHLTGPANLQIASHGSAGAVVDLQYDYTGPGGGTPGGGDGSGFYLFDNPIPPSVLLANTVTGARQTFNIADSTTGWNDSLAVQEFNPALGTLQAVNITLWGNLQTSVAAENQDASAALIAVTQAAMLTLTLPGTTDTTAVSIASSLALGAYDGISDLAGASGAIEQGQTQMPTGSGHCPTPPIWPLSPAKVSSPCRFRPQEPPVSTDPATSSRNCWPGPAPRPRSAIRISRQSRPPTPHGTTLAAANGPIAQTGRPLPACPARVRMSRSPCPAPTCWISARLKPFVPSSSMRRVPLWYLEPTSW